MTTLCFANHKGGVGKTTSALNVAYALLQRGHTVLLVDCDRQHNLTQSFTYAPPAHLTLAAVLQGAVLEDVTVEVARDLWLVPSSPELGQAEKQLGQEPGGEMVLRELLSEVKGIDYCILDTPAGMGTLTYAALAAANAVFIPTQPEYYGLEGLAGLLHVCDQVRRRLNPGLKMGGLFFTQYNRNDRRRVLKDLVAILEDHATLGPLVMMTTIRENVAIKQAQTEKENLLARYPESPGAADYVKLTGEILLRL